LEIALANSDANKSAPRERDCLPVHLILRWPRSGPRRMRPRRNRNRIYSNSAL